MKALPAAAIIALVLVGPAAAQDDAGCSRFAWPVQSERIRLGAAEKPVLDTGAELAANPAGAFTMRLRRADQVTLAHPPERKREGHAGYVTIGALPSAGMYQVTLSQDAWLDLVQNGAFARSAGSSGRRDCAGLRKSVRFHLQASPIVLQVSGVEADEISIVIRQIE